MPIYALLLSRRGEVGCLVKFTSRWLVLGSLSDVRPWAELVTVWYSEFVAVPAGGRRQCCLVGFFLSADEVGLRGGQQSLLA